MPLRGPEVEMALFSMDDLYTKVNRTTQNDLFRLFGEHAVTGYVADVPLIPLNLDIHVP